MKKLVFYFIIAFIPFYVKGQVNPVKVTDYFADFEVVLYNDTQEIIYNEGNDITLPITFRFKLKNPITANNPIPPNSYAAIYLETVIGIDVKLTSGNNINLNSGELAPFELGDYYSRYLKTNLTIPLRLLFSGKLKVRFMSTNDPVNNSWSNPAIANFSKNITVVNVPNFIGPNQICDEATYTIERPDAITLQNASGIATLTSLGNDQWKVTRIGTGNGKVTLRSTSNGRTYEKDIAVGTPSPAISGTSQINTVGEYDYIVSRNTPGSTIEYNLMLGGDVELIPVSDTQFKIKVVNPNTSGSTMAVKVRARETSSCGTSSYTIKNINLNGNM